MQLLDKGLMQVQIAKRLGVSDIAIRNHTAAARRALKVNTNAELVGCVHEAGWLDPVDDGWEDERVTAGQRLYLDAFDRFLFAKTGESQTRARGEMTHHLGSMCIERQVPVPGGGKRRPQPGLERLMAVVDS